MSAADEILAGYGSPKAAQVAPAAGHRRDRRHPARPFYGDRRQFLPPLQPTLRTGTGALATAALAWLAP
ncbi:MAG: hypothetical protein ACLPKE_22885 [Streptosporangiaceae bacterium]